MSDAKHRCAGEGVNEVRRTRLGVEVECWDNAFEGGDDSLRYWGECRGCGQTVPGGEVAVLGGPSKPDRLRLWDEFYERIAAHVCARQSASKEDTED